MNSEWEPAAMVPARSHGGSKQRLLLEPGQIIRRQISSSAHSAGYNSRWKKLGFTDYHAATRTIDGVTWIYIWRDPLPEVKE